MARHDGETRQSGARSRPPRARVDRERHLSAAFRECAAGLGLRLDVSVRQVRRWESANPPWPTPDYERVLETLFGVPLDRLGFVRPPRMAGLERSDSGAGRAFRESEGDRAQPGWWLTESDEVAESVHYGRLLEAERSAVSQRCYLPTLLPGLLQTFEYAFTIIRAGSPLMPQDEVLLRAQRRVKRLGHVGRFSYVEGSLWFVIHDSALRNPVGGWQTLTDQLGHLLVVLSQRTDMRLQVLPDDVGAHPGLNAGPFTWYDFGRESVVYREFITGRLWTSDSTCLAAYSLVYAHLQAAALPVDESIELIAKRAREAELKVWATTPSSPTDR
ncbi:DUF5753 domain-containing protein [Embleya sp. NPDC020630]|uniref:DUF5753 domain-containing protein n=1 Tax=Embleya sp. NPDC020630 TaxID=3363979 RepID=UPI0037939097